MPGTTAPGGNVDFHAADLRKAKMMGCQLHEAAKYVHRKKWGKNGKVPSQSLTWNLKMMVFKRNLLLQGAIFRFHVKLWEGSVGFLGEGEKNTTQKQKTWHLKVESLQKEDDSF